MAFLLDELSTERFAIFKNITRIGSDQGCDITLTSEGVSGDHAHILREGDDYVIASLGRSRPLTINGKKEKRAILRNGDTLSVGDVSLLFQLEDIAQPMPEGDAPSSDDSLVPYQEIVKFSQHLLESKNLDHLLTALMDKVIELSQADKGFLVLLHDGEPDIRIARNLEQDDIGREIEELSDTVLAKVVREQKPVIVTDAANDREFKASASVVNLKLCSVMCVPLTEGGELFGVIYLGSSRVINLFETRLLETITVFASQASLLIRNAMLLDTLRADNHLLRLSLESRRFGAIVGASEQMQSIYHRIHKVAPTDVSVLITGETGTGKELIAKEIHERSDRKDNPFIVVNCGAIPENLLESELFGHVKGAFTGAVQTREGRFQQAHKGTLFLDEIGELATVLQVKLLRALQEKTVTRVGGTKPDQVDIRIVAATNRNLEEQISQGAFREDLYYRLNVVGIHLPALAERGDDLMLIARFLLKRYAEEFGSKVKGFSPRCALLMKKYRWPGNIRQLENRIKKAVIMSEQSQLTAEDLELSDQDLEPVKPLNQAKEEFQRNYINEVLERNNGNRTKTAHDLGVDPRTIFRHLEREATNHCDMDGTRFA